MHELSIAVSLIETACAAAALETEFGRVVRLYVRVGRLAGVDESALRFAFPLAAEGTKCEGATLVVEHVAGSLCCLDCGREFAPPEPLRFRCPICGGAATIRCGRELELVSLELDDGDAESS